MKKRKIIGTITVLVAGPNVGFMLFFVLLYQAPLFHWLVIEKFLIVVSCILGGIFLWRSSIWGHRFSIVGWILILWTSVSSMFVEVYPTTNENLKAIILSKDIIFSIFSLTILSILLGDIIRQKRSNKSYEQTGKKSNALR